MRKDALGTSGARRARWHAGDERCGGKILATEEGAPSEHNGINWASEAHLGVLGGDLEHVMDGGEDVAEVEEEDGRGGIHGSWAPWSTIFTLWRKKMETMQGQGRVERAHGA